jgi:hypothetical protein
MRVSLNLSEQTSLTYAVLAARVEMPTEEAYREALSLYWWMARERSTGTRFLVQRGDKITELVVPSLDRLNDGPPLEGPPE